MSENITESASASTSISRTPDDGRPEVPDDLLTQTLQTTVEGIQRAAEAAEGMQPSSVVPIHYNRQIKCYQITEQELDSITLVNVGISTLFGIGSFLMAFWLDIFKDTLLAESIPEAAAVAVSYVKPICAVLGLTFWFGAVALLFWRRSFISDIKRQSFQSNITRTQ